MMRIGDFRCDEIPTSPRRRSTNTISRLNPTRKGSNPSHFRAHSGQFLSSALAQVSPIALEFSRRNFSLLLLKCMLFQTGNPFRR
jgi:hypothetical protein